jgi:hypothetical protein
MRLFRVNLAIKDQNSDEPICGWRVRRTVVSPAH